VILNACKSLQKIAARIAPFTIGVSEAVGDEEALNFSRGFYDALSAGKGYEEAFAEGTMAVGLAGGEADKLRLNKELLKCAKCAGGSARTRFAC
jgi:hypothetical protein